MSKVQSPRLIVDAWNIFIAGFKASERVSATGKPVGGVLFLLRTIAQLSSEIHAKSIDVIWETDGSPRRRSIYKFYKQGRNPASRVNRPYGETEGQTTENMLWQISWATKLLGLSGCNLYNVPGAEADDVISHLVRYKYRFEPVVVLTGDNDMYQLCDVPVDLEAGNSWHPRVRVFDSKLRCTTGQSVFDVWGIDVSNWSLAKAIVGDTSDNIDGISGMGWKKVAKIEPLTKPDATIDDVWRWVEQQMRETKKPQKWIEALMIASNRKLVERNLKLISLFSLTGSQAAVFENQFANPVDDWMDQVAWMREMNREGVLQLDLWNGLSCEGFRHQTNVNETNFNETNNEESVREE
jgi:5'-3' exonuclease